MGAVIVVWATVGLSRADSDLLSAIGAGLWAHFISKTMWADSAQLLAGGHK